MRRIHLTLALAIPFLGLSCIDSHSNMGPDSCFTEAYKLALDGKYDDTAEYFTDEILNYMKNNPDTTLQKIWADRLNNGEVKGVKIIERQADEKNYDVKFMLLTDGGMTDAEDTMVFEKGLWKFDKMKRVR